MKRAPQEPIDQRKMKKIAPLREDAFGVAMRAACLRKGHELSNQPLIVNGLDSNCWLSAKVAYWPINEAIGRHVWQALKKEDNMHSAFDDNHDIHLITAFMSFDDFGKRLCKLLGVNRVSELGVLKHVSDYCGDKHVDAALLDVCEFRLDLHY